MKTDNIIAEKSKSFALRIIKLYKHLCDEKKNMYCQNKFFEAEQALAQILKKQLEDKVNLTFMPK